MIDEKYEVTNIKGGVKKLNFLARCMRDDSRPYFCIDSCLTGITDPRRIVRDPDIRLTNEWTLPHNCTHDRLLSVSSGIMTLNLIVITNNRPDDLRPLQAIDTDEKPTREITEQPASSGRVRNQ